MRDHRTIPLDVLGDTPGSDTPVAGTPSFAHVRFFAELERDDHSLKYLGPTIRGAMGYALKAVACSMPHRECDGCLLRTRCAYPLIFDGASPSSELAHGHPFALEVASPDTWWGEHRQLAWGLRLYGETAAWLPHIVAAMLHAGHKGLGPDRVPYALTEVLDASDQRTLWRPGEVAVGRPGLRPLIQDRRPHGPCTLRWHFHTPLHLAREGEAVAADRGLELVLAGRRRLGALCAGHGWRLAEEERSPAHLDAADFRTLDARLEPWSIERFSGRQRRRVPLRGVVGFADINGPWHLAGAWLGAAATMHLGKHPTFGLGRVSWEPVESIA